jgi:hypothetical protein
MIREFIVNLKLNFGDKNFETKAEGVAYNDHQRHDTRIYGHQIQGDLVNNFEIKQDDLDLGALKFPGRRFAEGEMKEASGEHPFAQAMTTSGAQQGGGGFKWSDWLYNLC